MIIYVKDLDYLRAFFFYLKNSIIEGYLNDIIYHY